MSIIRLDSNFVKTTGILRVSEFVRRMYLATMAVSALDFIWENLVTISFETVWTFRSFYLWIIKSVCSATGVEMFSQSIRSCLQCLPGLTFPHIDWYLVQAGSVHQRASRQPGILGPSPCHRAGQWIGMSDWMSPAACYSDESVNTCCHMAAGGAFWRSLAGEHLQPSEASLSLPGKILASLLVIFCLPTAADLVC